MSAMDPALKPRLRRRSAFEYVAWVVCCLLAVGILFSVSTNPNFKWDVVARYFTHETILRGLMLTIFLTVASMVLGTLLGLVLAIMRSSQHQTDRGHGRASTSPCSAAPRSWCS